LRIVNEELVKSSAFLERTVSWRVCRSNARLAGLPSALETNRRYRRKTRNFLHNARNPQLACEFALRSHRDHLPDRRWFQFRQQIVDSDSRPRIQSVVLGSPGLGNWIEPRRSYRVRH